MPVCQKCGEQSSRRRRGLLLRLFSKASFRCAHCGANTHFHRPFFAIFHRWAECPICQNHNLRINSKADKVDRVSMNVLRRALFLFGYPLYHCTFCRYQFRDWRKLDPNRDNR